MLYNICSTASYEITELCKLKKIRYYLNLTGIFISYAFSVSEGRIDETQYTYWTFHLQISFCSRHSGIKKGYWFLCLLFRGLSPCCSKFCFLTLSSMVLYFLVSFQKPQKLKNWFTSYYC